MEVLVDKIFKKIPRAQTTVYTVVRALFTPLCGNMVVAVARILSVHNS